MAPHSQSRLSHIVDRSGPLPAAHARQEMRYTVTFSPLLGASANTVEGAILVLSAERMS